MSDWKDLPDGFLRLGYDRWRRFDSALQDLIVKLAREQQFRCALCTANRDLIVEHDHDPYIGDYKRPTTYNTRGLVCHACNRHIDFYEQRERGEYGWDHVLIRFSDLDYEDYIDAYNRRVLALWENDLRKRMGDARYYRRKRFVTKFYDWREGWDDDYPWTSHFEEIRHRKQWIRDPALFFRTLLALMNFYVDYKQKNPDYQPPEDFIRVVVRVKPMLDELRPIVEARLRERGPLDTQCPS